MIPIQNLYYMLAYAFRVLHERRYQGFVSEPFPNAGELLAAILIREVSGQLKQGMGRDYLSRSEPLSAVRGKLDLSASLKDQTLLRRQLVCRFSRPPCVLSSAPISRLREKKKCAGSCCTLGRWIHRTHVPSPGTSTTTGAISAINC